MLAAVGKIIAFDGQAKTAQFIVFEVFNFGQITSVTQGTALTDDRPEASTEPRAVNRDIRF
jgi:hypothetical protein